VVQVKGDNKGININDEDQDFTGQILRGEKTIETRPSRSLDSRIGKLTGIIRTGVGKATLVGYAVIGEPVVYDSVAKFRRDYSKHRVAPGSIHDIKDGLKYGYPLMQVESATPKELTSTGRVIRQLNPYTRPDIRNPRRSMIRSKLSRIIEPGDRVLDYDRAQGEDLYRLWDLVHTDMALTPEALVEIEGMLDDDGVLVIQSGEEPAGLRDHFRRVVKYQGMLLVQGPMNPEEARINTEKLRRDLE
jgi:hypothetical protein